MNRLLHLLAAAMGAAIPFVFDAALKGALLLAVAALCVLALRGASAATRHLVWLVAVVALLLVPILSVSLPQWRVLPKWVAAPAASELPPTAPRVVRDVVTERAEPLSNAETNPIAGHETLPPMPSSRLATAAPVPVEIVKPATPAASAPRWWRVWLPLLWCAGCAACALRLVVAYLLLRRATAACEEVKSGPLVELLSKACAQLGVRQHVRLLMDTRRTIPVVWGVFRPRLVLPAEAEDWSERQLRSVLLHELAHIRRRDTAVQWLTQIVCALHWFNPLVWLAAWRLHAERERACDDLVLASGVRASDYAEHLLHVATKLQGAGWASACGLAMARPSRLEGRLLAVLSERLNRRRVTALLAAVALALGACIAIPLAMLRAAEDTWTAPQAAHIGGNTRSTYCVHDGVQSAFVLFHEGTFGSLTESGSNPKTRTWTDSGRITLDNGGKTFAFFRDHTAPESLTLNGTAYDLTKGRAFVLGKDGSIRQLALNPPAIRDHAELEKFAPRVAATLAALAPQMRAQAHPTIRGEAGAGMNYTPLSPWDAYWKAHLIRPGQGLDIVVPRDPTFSGHYEVDSQGNILLAVVGRVKVGGMTYNQAQQTLGEALGKEFTARSFMVLIAHAEEVDNDEAVFLPGDRLGIMVREDASFNGQYEVRRGGYIIMPQIGRVSVAGKSLAEAKAAVIAALQANKPNLKATVTVERLEKKQVSISEPKSSDARALFEKWKALVRGGKVPGALIGELAGQVDSFLQRNAQGADKAKLSETRKRMDGTRDWDLAEAIALLDEIATVSPAPIGWEDLELTFSKSDNVTGGQPLPVELQGAAWGKPVENGLRAAWMLEPMRQNYPLGSVLKARVLFHNTGKEAITFTTDEWHQFDGDAAQDPQGKEIHVNSTMYSGVTLTKKFRLGPGEYCEVPGHGIGVGVGKYEEEFSVGSIGAVVEAKVGDEVSMHWTVDAQGGGWTRSGESQVPDEKRKAAFLRRANREGPIEAVSDKAEREKIAQRIYLDLIGTNPTPEEIKEFVNDVRADALSQLALHLLQKAPAVPFQGKLPTGEVKFRVVDADLEAAKKPRSATGPGRYVLSNKVQLQLSRITGGGHEQVTNKATLIFFADDPKADAPFPPYEIQLPDGMDVYAFAWQRDTGELWLGEKDALRKYEFHNPASVQEVKYTPWGVAGPPAIRELLEKALKLPSTKVPAPEKTAPQEPGGSGPTPGSAPGGADVRPADRDVLVANGPGRWELPGHVELEIPNPAAGGPVNAILHWPARAQWPALRHEFTIASAANKAKWALGWVPGRDTIWVVAGEPGSISMTHQIIYKQPEQIFDNAMSRRDHEPLGGMEIPEPLARAMEKNFTIEKPDPTKVELPGGPYVGGQQIYAAKTEQVWTIEGGVFDTKHQPMVGVEVEAYCEHYPLLVLDHDRTDGFGAYRVSVRLGVETLAAFRGLQIRPKLPPGLCDETLSRSGEFNAVLQPGEKIEHPFATEDLVLGEVGHAHFVLKPGCTLTGQIVDEQGRPQAKRFIAAQTPGQRLGYSIASATADDQGNFRLEHLPADTAFYLHTAAFAHPSQNGSSALMKYTAGGTYRLKVTVDHADGRPEKVTVELDPDAAPEPPEPKKTSALPTGIPPLFHGLELEKIPHTANFRDLSDLWQPDPTAPGNWTRVAGLFEMPIYGDEKAWLKYLPEAKVYYLEMRDGDGKDVTFGPIKGDPFAQLGLREVMLKNMTEWGRSGDVRNRAAWLLRYPSTMRFAAELFQAIHRPISLREFDDEIEGLAKAVTKAPDAETKAALESALARMKDFSAKREASRAHLPDSAYSKADGNPLETPHKIGSWSNEQNGLRMGVWADKEDHWKQGQPVEMEVWVCNASDKPVKFQNSPRQDVGLRLWLKGKDGKIRDGEIVMNTTPVFADAIMLEPGKVYLTKKFTVTVVAPRERRLPPATSGWDPKIEAAPGEYQFGCEVSLPGIESADAEGNVSTPAAGEWFGQLKSGEMKATVVE